MMKGRSFGDLHEITLVPYNLLIAGSIPLIHYLS